MMHVRDGCGGAVRGRLINAVIRKTKGGGNQFQGGSSTAERVSD